MISLIIPSYNNLQHLKNAYASIQKHAPTAEVILLDDGSTDGTWDWIQNQKCIPYKSACRVGHTILYDIGVELATNDIVGILHADMIIGPNYVENMIKHLKRGRVVCATRIEPPLHPAGKEKIIRDFGMDFDSLDVGGFDEYAHELQTIHEGETTRGMFAPWIIHKDDFITIGGHDCLFAPFPYEDSDIFQRWILNGFELIQSRDSFVYHLTCRGHRWNDQVGVDDEYYRVASNNAARNYLRKWRSWIRNDEYQHPMINHKYDIGFIIENCTGDMIAKLEPLCSTIYVDCNQDVVDSYISVEQGKTLYDLSNRIRPMSSDMSNDILVKFDGRKLDQQSFEFLLMLAPIISSSGEIGEMEYGIFKIDIRSMSHYEHDNIIVDNSKERR